MLQGVGPNVNRAAVVVGVELPVYDFIKKCLINTGHMTDTVPAHFL